jgi:hypothetical protein
MAKHSGRVVLELLYATGDKGGFPTIVLIGKNKIFPSSKLDELVVIVDDSQLRLILEHPGAWATGYERFDLFDGPVSGAIVADDDLEMWVVLSGDGGESDAEIIAPVIDRHSYSDERETGTIYHFRSREVFLLSHYW